MRKQWLTTRIPGTITVRTEMLYAHVVHAYINPSLGKIRLAKLTPSDVARMLQDLEAKNYSSSTRRMARATLRRALRMADVNGQFKVPAGGHEKSSPFERELLLLRRELSSPRSGLLHSK